MGLLAHTTNIVLLDSSQYSHDHEFVLSIEHYTHQRDSVHMAEDAE